MKKIVILMLALMLALISVSAMAADQSKTGTGTLDVAVKYSVPESFEWSAPSEVTLNDDIFTSDGMIDVIKVTLNTANLKMKLGSMVEFTVETSLVLVGQTGGTSLFVTIGTNYFSLYDDVPVGYFSKFKADCSKDGLGADDYTGSVTIVASML